MNLELHKCYGVCGARSSANSVYPEILLTEAGVGYQLAPSVDERPFGETDQSPGDETKVQLL